MLWFLNLDVFTAVAAVDSLQLFCKCHGIQLSNEVVGSIIKSHYWLLVYSKKSHLSPVNKLTSHLCLVFNSHSKLHDFINTSYHIIEEVRCAFTEDPLSFSNNL